jgi:hypothetical protein
MNSNDTQLTASDMTSFLSAMVNPFPQTPIVKKRVYHFYSDSGHGWLKVPFKDLVKLNIANKISSYSYEKGEFIYLEEDGDLSTFIKAHGNDWKDKLVIKEHHTNRRSKIRSYYSFNSWRINHVKSEL